MKTIVRIIGLRCPRCKHEWAPRKQTPAQTTDARRCPRCFFLVAMK